MSTWVLIILLRAYSSNMSHSNKGDLMLACRLRRRTNIKLPLGERPVFAVCVCPCCLSITDQTDTKWISHPGPYQAAYWIQV